MDQNNKPVSDLFGALKSWIPWRAEPANVSRDFWMPDNSCSVCYECDSKFNLINRRHHCRLCGRIFCAKCTENSIPAPPNEFKDAREEAEKIRVCNYCFKQWEQGIATTSDNVENDTAYDPSSSPSGGSFGSSASSRTAYCSTITLGSMSFSLGRCEQLSQNSSLSLYQSPDIDRYQSAVMDLSMDGQGEEGSASSNNSEPETEDQDPNQFGMDTNRYEYEDDGYSYELDSKTWAEEYCEQNELEGLQDAREASHSLQPDGEKSDSRSFNYSALQNSYNSHDSSTVQDEMKDVDHDMGDECEAPSSLCAAEDIEMEPVDFDNNGLLWLPPEPENEEDEKDAILLDDDDEGDPSGEFKSLRTSGSFGSGEFRNRDKSTEDHKNAMKNIVDGHFRALVSQLLQVENIPMDEDDDRENWLEIITSLSWEAATILKPDMSRGGGMDPGGYVKVKCVASGRRSESMVVKGVVCKKNVAHRRMTTRIEKPRLMILGGALEYQRVSNHLSSVDTLLKQEMDHLKMAVAKIYAHNPSLLLVEKSVSRFAQDYILEKDISLVLNIKRPLLERIARCTGAQIVPSVDHLSSQKIGYCDSFHVDRFVEEHGSAGQAGKKLSKTLMFFEGCPKPLGCTILLRGAIGDELKKVKGVIQYGVFAAYNLALEISFLADEGASLPELPLKEPITVALPNKSLRVDSSISMVPGFNFPANGKSNASGEPHGINGVLTPATPCPTQASCLQNSELAEAVSSSADCLSVDSRPVSVFSQASSFSYKSLGENPFSAAEHTDIHTKEYKSDSGVLDEYDCMHVHKSLRERGDPVPENDEHSEGAPGVGEVATESSSLQHDAKTHQEEPGSSKEEFPPSQSDNQSILVSLSSRCFLKGTVCERSHLFRIKYYGSFDKPLGRYLQDHLFDQNYRCRSCEMPSDAHVQCYTHRQGTLTISVKKLPEILLPGECEGKIWMWHRCLKCPRMGGNPPATRRVIMSDAAWGLSFGKFLELSFSNHAAASRVASCGHSLHRDCLRFYGSGKMVACFRYASIDVHSVFLPPFKVDFSHEIQDWIKKEADELVDRAEVLFTEVLNALTEIVEKKSGGGSIKSSIKAPESRARFAELEEMLQNEKAEFEEALQKTLNRELTEGQPAVDILEINRLRRQLLFQSYMWDNRLVHASKMDFNSCLGMMGCNSQHGNRSLGMHDAPGTNMLSPSKGLNSANSLPLHSKSSAVSPRTDEEINSCPKQHNTLKQMSEAVSEAKPVSDDVVSYFDCDKSFEAADKLDSEMPVRRALSDGQFSFIPNLSDTLDAAWTGKSQPGVAIPRENSFQLSVSVSVDSSLAVVAERLALETQNEDLFGGFKFSPMPSPAFSTNSKNIENVEDSMSWLRMPFRSFYSSLNKNILGTTQKFDTVAGYNPTYVSSYLELELRSGGRLHLPVGANETVIPVFDDEPTSIISYALVSQDYYTQLSDDGSIPREMFESAASLPLHDLVMFQSFNSGDDSMLKSLGSLDESFLSMSASQSSLTSDPLLYNKSLHVRVSFSDNGPYDKVKYTVTCYYAKHFDALRKICCPSELDIVRSLSRCKKWGAQGGKSNVTKTELESFIKFAPEYFKYLTEAISTKSPTCLAKILGIYQVTTKHLKGGREIKMDVLVMENLLFGRKVTRLYDLKGSARSRYNADANGSNKVLLDQNLIESMPTSPIFVGNKAKRLLERAVWNDTAFLASVDVMDYSLLVGIDEEKHELVLGIIDFMRQYTWDKHLETWVKASGILGGSKNAPPTVISPKQYKKRFRKAMTTYFLMVPDQWSPPSLIPAMSQTDLCEDNS
ncbi:hypothetical protein V2J09_023391 [Rumex salicifolius]